MTTDKLNKVYEILIRIGGFARCTGEELDAWEEFCQVLLDIVEEYDKDKE